MCPLLPDTKAMKWMSQADIENIRLNLLPLLFSYSKIQVERG